VNAHPTLSLSIAIVCYHSDEQDLRRLIESLIDSIEALTKNQFIQPIPIYLIDNSEAGDLELALFDDLATKAMELEPAVQLHLIQGQGNIGYGRAHNLVLKDLESDFHLMLNPDVVLDEQCLVEGLAYFAKNPGTAMASPIAQYNNGDPQYLCKRYPCVFTLLIRGFLPAKARSLFSRRVAHYEMHELYSANSKDQTRVDIPIASGCFMFCRTEALKTINGFNERYFLYFEDFDLSLRIAKQGNIAFLPSMRIIHGGGNAAKKGLKHIGLFVRSGLRFFNSHGWRWFKQ
jgi:GT2 family glycosyltransferase